MPKMLLKIGFVCFACACAPAPQPAAPAPISASTGKLVGQWQGCDGRQIEFSREDGQIVGRYIALGKLGAYGFRLGEIGYLVTPAAQGSYTGKAKWRFSDGRQEWRELTIQVNADGYTDTGSDNCSKTMTRVEQ